MPVSRIRLTDPQIEDLKTVCALGSDTLNHIARSLNDSGAVVKPSHIQKIISALTDEETAKTARIVLLGLATAGRRTFQTIPELLDNVADSITQRSPGTLPQWESSRAAIEAILR